MGAKDPFPGARCGRGVMLTTHHLLVPRLRKIGRCTTCSPSKRHPWRAAQQLYVRTRNRHLDWSWMTHRDIHRIQISLLYGHFYERVKEFSWKMSSSSASSRSYVVINKDWPNVANELVVAMLASYREGPGFKLRPGDSLSWGFSWSIRTNAGIVPTIRTR
jgi:hypothetical protein